MKWIEKTYKVNGYEVSARYAKENIEEIFKPFLTNLYQLQKTKKKRIIVYVAAPPACGKSTLVLFLCDLAKELGYHNVQSIGMDGFHYPNEYLDFHFIQGKLLREVKGCPESFHLEKLCEYIKNTKETDLDWPEYDRSIHNPKEHAVHVDQDIVLLEGNYLLLEEAGWKDLRQYCDYSMYIKTEEKVLEKRLIDRKAKSTNTREEAIAFYQKSDQKNIQRVLMNTLDADVILELDPQGFFHIIKN